MNTVPTSYMSIRMCANLNVLEYTVCVVCICCEIVRLRYVGSYDMNISSKYVCRSRSTVTSSAYSGSCTVRVIYVDIKGTVIVRTWTPSL